MAERSAVRRPVVAVEPVCWKSHLVRAPRVVYTEVAGTPVLVRVDDAELQPLPPAWAAMWAALDGRPLTEALSVDPTSIDPIRSRNLIEVLRRLKAKRLVVDIGSLSPEDRSDVLSDDLTAQPSSHPANIALRGRLVPTPEGATLTLAAPPTLPGRAEHDAEHDAELHDLVTVHVVDVDGSLEVSAGGAPLRVLVERAPTRGSGTPYDPAHDASDLAGASSGVAGETAADVERCVVALAGMLAALADPACLAEPGVIDLLAALAEQTHPAP